MRMERVNKVVKHYKGQYYRVLYHARDAWQADNRDERVVVYQALYATDKYPEGQIWTREWRDFYAQNFRVHSLAGGFERVVRYRFKPVTKIPRRIRAVMRRLDRE
jgi:hypothetical protein